MMNVLILTWSLTIVAAVFLLYAKSLLFWVNYLQIKQYRIDRLWSSVSTRSFWKLFFSKTNILLLLLFASWQVLVRPDPLNSLTAFSVITLLTHGVIVLLAISTLLKYFKKKLQMPKWTKKSLAIVLSIFVFDILLVAYYHFSPEQVILLELLQPFIVFTVFTVLFVPNYFLQDKLKDKARTKRLAMKDLQVIGITGSYGKTIMKEYLAFLLENKYKVAKTPHHINVDTGIAKIVLEELKDDTEIFVVEMGAYRKGEIKSSCEIAQPDIAVMTALGTQHIELFGSQEKLTEGKFELVDAVEDKSRVFANKQSEKLVKAFEKRNIHPNWYGFSEELPVHVKYLSTAQKVTLDGAVKVAQSLGMTTREIQKRIDSGLPKIEGTMNTKQGKAGAIVIDDTYNASTGAVLAALSDLAQNNKPKKLFVFKEIIELADLGKEEHEKIAVKAARSATDIFLLSGDYSEFMKEVLEKNNFDMDHVYSQESADQFFAKADKQAVVLFEGRDAGKYLSRVL